MDQTKIAFLGLGLMGAGMARCLLAAGYSLNVYNRTEEKARPLMELGATVADSPARAAADASIILSMLADDSACREAWLGKDGALAAANPGAILVESSTVSVCWIEELKKAAQLRNLELIDAPVTGSRAQAADGKLLFLAGGSAEALAKVTPVLRSMSRDIVHLGPTGSGARMKLINNFMCGVQAASLAEGLSMIERSGLDATKAVGVLTNGAPGSPLVTTLSARMMRQEYQPQFLLRLMTKDLRYAVNEAGRYEIDLITCKAALRVFESAIEAGKEEEDFSAVVEQFR